MRGGAAATTEAYSEYVAGRSGGANEADAPFSALRYATSNSPAAPMPPPMHIVHTT
jgi:hypothetical protein